MYQSLHLWTTDYTCLIRDNEGGCLAHNLAVTIPKSPQLISTVHCAKHFLGICFTHPPLQAEPQIFGFSIFVTALTLMSVVFTISDPRFRFRIAIVGFPLVPLSLVLTAFIGAMVLYADIAFPLQWLMPKQLANPVYWQSTAAAVFLLLILTWLYFGLLRPPVFSAFNAARFTGQCYRIILNGDDADMRMLANELARSAKNVIQLASNNSIRRPRSRQQHQSVPASLSVTERHAHSLLLLIGAPRFCRQIISSAPGTAIAFFTEMSRAKKYFVPIHQFAKNISAEAILNRDSLLYHERNEFDSGALGYWKPFSQAIYGDYALVEALGELMGSPLDIGYSRQRRWDATQLSAYTQATLITLADFLKSGGLNPSPCLARAFQTIKESPRGMYEIDALEAKAYESDAVAQLQAAVDFVKDAVKAIDEIAPALKPVSLRIRQRNRYVSHDIFDQLAALMFDLIDAASFARRTSDLAWSIQYITVWSQFFDPFDNSKAWAALRFKVRRLIYDEITRFDGLNYKSARILGLCLNVLGIKPVRRTNSADRVDHALKRALLAWSRTKLMKCWEQRPDVVESGLPANLQINPRYRRIVRTFPKFLQRKPKIVYFQLD